MNVYDLSIKSQTRNRLRLKSISFNKSSLNEIQTLLKSPFISFRINTKCHCVIINFNEKKIKKEQILSKFKLIKQELSTPACTACQSTQKRSVKEFLGLSAFASYLFYKSQILGVAIVSTPFSLVALVSLVAAIPLLKDALQDVKNKKFTLQSFMSFSLLLAIFGGEAMAAFEIIYILRASELFEQYISDKSKKQIRDLIQNDIKKAYIVDGNLEVEISIENITKEHIVVCRSGEKIPVDGTIIKGEAEIDESIINGRANLEHKLKNDKVFANTLVEKGRVYIKVDAIGKDTYIQRVLSEVEKSLQIKSDGELAAEILAQRVLKLGSILTLATFGLTGSLVRAFSVMIVMSCPCSTILAASSAISAGIARGAKEGILIKGGKFLEQISQCDVFCFDKTGTLTTREPIITDIIADDEKLLFTIALNAEQRNTHPIATSITKHAKSLNIEPNLDEDSEALIGLGVKCKFKNKETLIGNAKLLDKFNIKNTYKSKAKKLLDAGKSVVYVVYDKKIIGMLALSHQARKNTKEMLNSLKQKGVKKLILLTGDEQKVAQSFADEYGFDEVYSNLMPDEKANIVESLRQKYEKITMIGDGVNDTLALSKADIGISFASGGSEAATQISNIAITHSEPNDIIKLYELSQTSLKTINQNYYIGTSTNILGVSLASLGLLSPILAASIHIAHTAGIILNSSKISFKSLSNKAKVDNNS